MKFRIVIPSYKRSETLKTKTLKYLLEDCKINSDIIDVWVADEEEYEIYKTALEGIEVNIFIGVPTLKAQRNFIVKHYNEGDYILNIDDDIEGIYVKSGDKTKLFTDIEAIVKDGFNECKKNRTKLWGICAVNNGFYMDYTISTNLKYIIGCFWGNIIDKSESLLIELEDKEDYERTIKYFKKFKKVVRLNMYAPKSAFYTEPGGMQETRTSERIIKSAIYLAQTYPEYCKMNPNRTKHAEIVLNSRAK